MGLTLSVRDLIGERAIYRHEQAAGLSPSAYLLAKIGVFSAVAVAQSALLVLVVTAPGIGKRAPATAAVLGVPMLELFVDVAATAAAAAVLGLVISAVSRSSNQYIPLLAVACVAQLVLAGSFVPITGRPVLEVIAGLTPARWGVAATASTIDLPNLVPAVHDPLWKHSASAWLFDIAMLVVLALRSPDSSGGGFEGRPTRSAPLIRPNRPRAVRAAFVSRSLDLMRRVPAASGSTQVCAPHPGSPTPESRVSCVTRVAAPKRHRQSFAGKAPWRGRPHGRRRSLASTRHQPCRPSSASIATSSSACGHVPAILPRKAWNRPVAGNRSPIWRTDERLQGRSRRHGRF